MEMKLELVAVPVTDVDRAKDFYVRAGFNPDHDHAVSEDVRFVQLTPPGSACSIAIGNGLTEMAPGSLDNMQMVVADADASRADLIERGIEVSEVDEQPWGRFVYFSDPDGNRWALQQLPDWGGPVPAARRLAGGGRRTRGVAGQNQVLHQGTTVPAKMASATATEPGVCSSSQPAAWSIATLGPPSDTAPSVPTGIVRSALADVAVQLAPSGETSSTNVPPARPWSSTTSMTTRPAAV